LFAAAATWWSARPEGQSSAGNNTGTFRSRIQTLLGAWIATIVLFFSFSASKQDLYIYPVMPAVAALGGAVIVNGLPGTRWLSAFIGGVLALAGAGILLVFQASGNVFELAGVTLVGGLAVVGGLATTTFAIARRWRIGLLLFLAAGVLINWVLVWRVLPSFEKYKPVPPITAFLEARAADDDVIAHYSVALPSMVYYMRRHIDVTYDRDAFIRIMQQPKRIFAVLWTEEYERLRNDLNVPTCAIYSTPSFNIKLNAVMKREPLPELVVITNRCQ
jgi:4-amino-4-deoxy-L-arabinose transferase-like glycosyltransferase